MRSRPLPGTGLTLSEVGLGCASYWGKKIYSERQAIEVVHEAMAQGVTYFDTGHSYSGGHAEIRLGRALTTHPRQHQAIISTKVGTRVGHLGRLYKDFSPGWIQKSIDQSLRQLRIQHIPLLFLHGPNPEDFNPEVFGVLEQLKTAGKVGAVGVNAFDDVIIQLAADSGQFQCVMLDHNLFRPHRSEIIRELTNQGLGVIVAGALAGGIYNKDFKSLKSLRSTWYWLRALKNAKHEMAKVQALDFLHEEAGWDAVQLALAYVLSEEKITSALIGTTQTQHLKTLTEVSGRELPDHVNQQIQSFQKGMNS